MVINDDALSISAVQFNPLFVKAPKWTEYNLGNSSIHFRHDSDTAIIEIEGWEPFDYKKSIFFDKGMISLYEHLTQDPDACSFEVLGYGKLGVSEPLLSTFRIQRPSFGVAYLELPGHGRSVKCMYRAMYENWRMEMDESAPHFWPMLFYCPIVDVLLCTNLTSYITSPSSSFRTLSNSVPLRLTVPLARIQWRASFRATMKLPRNRIVKKARVEDRSNGDLSSSSSSSSSTSSSATTPVAAASTGMAGLKYPDMGICTSIPYTTTNPKKQAVNNALLREWIRYYLKLGLMVFIYDGGGRNFDAVYSDPDGPVMGRDSYEKSPFLVYHNYTIRQRLVTNTLPDTLLYDNEEANKNLEDFHLVQQRKRRYFVQGLM